MPTTHKLAATVLKKHRSVLGLGLLTGCLEGAAIGMGITVLTGGLGVWTIPIFALCMGLKKLKDRYFMLEQATKSRQNGPSWSLFAASFSIDILLGLGTGYGLIHSLASLTTEILAGVGIGFGSSWLYEVQLIRNATGKYGQKNERSKILAILGATVGFVLIAGLGLATGGLFLLIPVGLAVVGWAAGHCSYGLESSKQRSVVPSVFAACGAILVLGLILGGVTGGLSIPIALVIAGGVAAASGVLPYLWKAVKECFGKKGAETMYSTNDEPTPPMNGNNSSSTHSTLSQKGLLSKEGYNHPRPILVAGPAAVPNHQNQVSISESDDSNAEQQPSTSGTRRRTISG